jgi:hypothetical protein
VLEMEAKIVSIVVSGIISDYICKPEITLQSFLLFANTRQMLGFHL